MRSPFLKKVIAATVMCTAFFSSLPTTAHAAWVQDYFGSWRYTEGYGVATGWRFIGGTWYYFNSYGIMQTGWIYTNGTWYYTDASGAMQTGVIQVNNKIYVLASNGAMQTGSVIVDGKVVTLDYSGAAVGANIPTPTNAFDWKGERVHAFNPNQIIDLNPANSDAATNDVSEDINTYKVKFKDDDGDDLKTKTVEEGDKLKLYEPSKNGYVFVEWNTKKNGKGTGYDADTKVKITEDLTLYAQWEEEEEEEVIKVKTITVTGASGLTEITTKGGTLQMIKKVTPSTATNAAVTWSVTNLTGKATISAAGKLTAVANGTVKVTATSKYGSKVIGTMTVNISGQDS